MNSSDTVKSNAVLDSDDDDEMDGIIAEFAEEEEKEQQRVQLSESEDEIDDLIEEFAAAETDSRSENEENRTNVPIVLSDEDDDVLEAISEEFKYDIKFETENSNSHISNSEIELNDNTQNNNFADAANNTTIDDGEYTVICDKDNKNKTIYSSSVEILDESSSCREAKESSVCIQNSTTNNYQPLSIIDVPKLVSDNMMSENVYENFTDEDNTTGTVVPESVAPVYINSVNSTSKAVPEALVSSDELAEIESEQTLTNKSTTQNPCNIKVNMSEDSTSVQNKNCKIFAKINISDEVKSHLIMSEILQHRDTKLIAKENDYTANESTSVVVAETEKSNCHNVTVNKSVETIENNASIFVSETESMQCSDIDDNVLNRVAITVSVKSLNNALGEEKVANENINGNENNLKVLTDVENCSGSREIFTPDISEENNSKVVENFPDQLQNVLPNSSHISPTKEENTNSDSTVENIMNNSVDAVDGKPTSSIQDSTSFSDSVKNVVGAETINTAVSNETSFRRDGANVISVSSAVSSAEAFNSNIKKTSPIKDPMDQMQSNCSVGVDDDVISTVNSVESNNLIDTDSWDAGNVLLESSGPPVLFKYESNVTVEDIQKNDAVYRNIPDVTQDNSKNAIVSEEVPENDGLHALINKKRKFECSESEFSNKRLKEDSCAINCDESSSDTSNDFALKDTNIEQLVSNVTVADIKAVDKINQLIPWNPAEKIETTEKTLDRIALHVCEDIVKECYKKKYNQGKNEVKILEKKIEKLTKDLENFFSLAKDFSSSQKTAFASKYFKKVGTRTVGVNVKIFRESEILRAIQEREEKDKTVLKILDINKESVSSVVPKNEACPKNNSNHEKGNAPPAEPKAETFVNDLPKTSSLPHITPASAPAISQTISSIPTKIPPPNVIKDGNRLIPYLNPSKPASLHNSPTLLVPVTTSVSSANNVQIGVQKGKPVQNGTVPNAAVRPNTTMGKDTQMTNGAPVLLTVSNLMKMFPNITNTGFSQQRGNQCATSPLQPRLIREGAMTNFISQRPGINGQRLSQLLQIKAPGPGGLFNPTTNCAIRASAISQLRSSQPRTSPSAGLLLFNHPRKDNPQVYSHHPAVSSFSSPVLARQQPVPVQNFTMTRTHPSAVVHQSPYSVLRPSGAMHQPTLSVSHPSGASHQPIFSVPRLSGTTCPPAFSMPCRPSHIHQPTFPVQPPVPVQHLSSLSQQRSAVIHQNLAIADHFRRSLQQFHTSVQHNSASLHHSTTSTSIHHNHLSTQSYLPADAFTDEKGRFILPKPQVKGSIKDDGSVVISWNLTLLDHHSEIAFYQIYSYQESEGPTLWKSVGDVASLALPMACTLSHFEDNAHYHFVVRIVDKLKRYGPFSDPVVIHYQKKKDLSGEK